MATKKDAGIYSSTSFSRYSLPRDKQDIKSRTVALVGKINVPTSVYISARRPRTREISPPANSVVSSG